MSTDDGPQSTPVRRGVADTKELLISFYLITGKITDIQKYEKRRSFSEKVSILHVNLNLFVSIQTQYVPDFKEGMKIRIWNAPNDLNVLLEAWEKEGFLVKVDENPSFMLAFVQTEDEVRKYLLEMHALSPWDEAIWIAYPKDTSKKYKPQINRDSDWKAVGALDYEGVRQIAIDEDWSALRFRKLKFNKTLTRSFSAKD